MGHVRPLHRQRRRNRNAFTCPRDAKPVPFCLHDRPRPTARRDLTAIMSQKDQTLTSSTNLVEHLKSDETDAKEIGMRITSLRNDKGLTLSELASLATVSKSYLSTVERGSGSRPGAAFLHKIAQALGVTIADLVGRRLVADSPNSPPELQALASDRNLPARDVEMLAGIAFRGAAPRTRERWEFIYNAIKSSAAMDLDTT